MRIDLSGNRSRSGTSATAAPRSDIEQLKLWEARLRSLLGDAAESIDLHYSHGRLFLCPEPGSDALDGCVASLLASSSDWDMVVVLPAGCDPHALGDVIAAAATRSPPPVPNGS